jgi:hypothetical protein
VVPQVALIGSKAECTSVDSGSNTVAASKKSDNILNSFSNLFYSRVRFVVFTAVTMKNVVFWDIKTQFVPHRRNITSPLQSPAG